MSSGNLETLRGGYEWFREHGNRFPAHLATPDFVWDMSRFHGWPEQQVYEGAEEAAGFISAWGETWDEWELDVEEMHEVGEDVIVAIMRQRGRSKLSGMLSEMSLAMVWTFRDGLESRMDMYSDPQEALRAFGLQG